MKTITVTVYEKIQYSATMEVADDADADAIEEQFCREISEGMHASPGDYDITERTVVAE